MESSPEILAASGSDYGSPETRRNLLSSFKDLEEGYVQSGSRARTSSIRSHEHVQLKDGRYPSSESVRSKEGRFELARSHEKVRLRSSEQAQPKFTNNSNTQTPNVSSNYVKSKCNTTSGFLSEKNACRKKGPHSELNTPASSLRSSRSREHVQSKDNRSEHATSKDGRFESRPHENVQSRARDRSSKHTQTKFSDRNTVTPSVSSSYVKSRCNSAPGLLSEKNVSRKRDARAELNTPSSSLKFGDGIRCRSILESSGQDDSSNDSDGDSTDPILPKRDCRESTSESRPSIDRDCRESRRKSLSSVDRDSLESTRKSPPSIGRECHESTSANEDLLHKILEEVKSSNQILQQKVIDLEKKYDELQTDQLIHKKQMKIKPSREVRDTVRKIYNALCENNENFGWDVLESFTSKKNQEVTKKLIADAKTHLPDVTSATIQVASRTYYTSIVGTKRLKTSGKYSSKCISQRRRNRLVRKLDARKTTLLKTSSFTEEEKKKWGECITEELMSSEESDEDGLFIVKPLPWRSERATKFLKSLDNKAERKKSRRSLVMTYKRSCGSSSDRPKPTTGSVPAWTLKP